MNSGTVVAIHIGRLPGRPMEAVDEVRALAHRGLDGDRKCLSPASPPAPGRSLTLIEIETVEALEREGLRLSAAGSRRNLATRGVRLNDLVGREFRIGGVSVRGVKPCHPCDHLESLTRTGVRRALENRGGLRADILTDGVIRVGDAVTPDPQDM